MKEIKPKLYIFSGLPGAGKTTLARLLSEHTGSVYLRIDTIEQGIRDMCSFKVEGEGYRLAYRIVQDNLLLGNNVVSDSTNPVEITRSEWEQVAVISGAHYLNIEVLCSDKQEHKRRIETRKSDIPNLELPSWEKVEKRLFESWHQERVVIDTARKSIKQSFDELLIKINKK